MRGKAVGLLAALLAMGASAASSQTSDHFDEQSGKPRVFVLTDIGNEPDDQMSLVRLLLYSNELEIEGLVATTSTHQRQKLRADTIRSVVGAYAKVRPNLMKHRSGWPAAETLTQRIAEGQPGYGLAAVGEGRSSPGSRLLAAAADARDERPLWVTVWGGANTLAQALRDERATRSPADMKRLLAKLRVYAISDQDDAGRWIRAEFPDLFYIVQPSSQNSEDYLYATWTGISGDIYYRNGEGADPTTITNEWLDRHIRSKGPLGAHYPRYEYIMEGDTPSFMNLLNNGLESHRNPSWGGWGGRYIYRRPAGESLRIWTQGGDYFGRVTSQDTVVGIDGRPHTSDQATIWRWRNDFQNDFAARMSWTVEPFAKANHNPQPVVNGYTGQQIVRITARLGEPVRLDASGSSDPDGDRLSYRWFHYAEAGAGGSLPLASIALSNENGRVASVTAPTACRPVWRPVECKGPGVAHIILAVSDDGSPALTSYRRIIMTVAPGASSAGNKAETLGQ